MRKKENKKLVKTRENAQLKIIYAKSQKKLVKSNIVAALIYVFQNRNKN